jgi:glutathione S-transferase
MYKLIIGNKRLSSWSMRPWLVMRQLGIPFAEELIPFWHADWAGRVQRAAGSARLAGTVPVLLDGALAIGDSLAIVEALAEGRPDAGVWPQDRAQRAAARSLCAEMHAGFGALRQECPFDTLRSGSGRALSAPAAAQLARAETLFAGAEAVGGFLCGAFCAADAFFAPLALRTIQYGLPLSAGARAYVERVAHLPAVAEWIADAAREHDWPVTGPAQHNDLRAVVNGEDAQRLAHRWIAAWNRRDLEAVLALFADHACFVSPKAEAFAGRARVEGKAALRDYWTKALAAISQLEFTPGAVDWDPAAASLVVTYQAELSGRRVRAAERWLIGADGLIADGEAYYGAALP